VRCKIRPPRHYPAPLFWTAVNSNQQAGPGAAILFTMLALANRHRIEPWTYLRELLLRLYADDPRLDEMLPDRRAANHPQSILSYRLDESRQKAARQRQRRQRRRAMQRTKQRSRASSLLHRPARGPSI
jgi:hypothetical protein